ncbi:MAG: serine/threonine-protein kinase [Anaerolineae bacterium]|nr:serine/threonine-protein kinase [Anaerolineae bacterium]
MDRDELIGRVVKERYEIVEFLGNNGTAEVFKAKDLRLKRLAAFKIIHDSLTHDARFRARFEREAHAVAQLDHANIVPVYDFDYNEEDKFYYMVMPFIGGGSLDDILKYMAAQGKRMSLKQTLYIITHVSRALQYAHVHGMVHRSVKPANVMVDKDRRVLLAGFGIAGMIGDDTTANGAPAGTPAYVAPEQGSGEPGDHRADIYALGVMFYEMATGKPPYEVDAPALLRHMTEPLTKPSTLVPDLPPGVEAIIVRMLAKNPDERYRSMDEVLADLKNYRQIDAPPAMSTAPALAPSEVEDKVAAPRRAFNLRLLWGCVSVSVVVVVVALAFVQGIGQTGQGVAAATGTLQETEIEQATPSPAGAVSAWHTATPPSAPPTATAASPPTREAGEGPRIAFSSDRDGSADIYIAQAGELRRLTDDGLISRGAAWSPDGSRVAYFACESPGGPCDIYVTSAASDNIPVNLTGAKDAANMWPAWSPDGAQIAFASDRDGDFEIYVMDAGGGDIRQITRNEADDNQPAWSPNGKTIAYASDAGGDLGIYAISAKGGRSRQIVDSPGHDEAFPAWSPDGSRLAFQSDLGADFGAEIWVIDLDGGLLTRLTRDLARDERPAWSPDGVHIAFASARAGAPADIYVMRAADGEIESQITDTGFDDGAPAWDWSAR